MYNTRVRPVTDLTVPDSESTTARRIVGASLKRTVKQLLALPAGRFDASVFDDFADVRAVMARALKSDRAGLVFAIMRRPTHSTLVRCIVSELYGDGDVTKLDTWLAELTLLCAIELARHDELGSTGLQLRRAATALSSWDGNFRLSLPEGSRIGLRDGTVVVQTQAEEVSIPIAELAEPEDSPGSWRAISGASLHHPYHPITDRLVLATIDNNPLFDVEAHPDKSGNAIDLADQPVSAWVEALTTAYDIVRCGLPEIADEIDAVMQGLVPVGADDQRHFSASYAEATGLAYLSLHPAPMTMAEALVHEFSHNKINALFDLDQVLENAFSPLFSSPVRPDPRPLHGVLLAVHAFVPVARLYERLIAQDHPLSQQSNFEARLSTVARGNHDGIATLLQHGRPTPVGKELLSELARWDEHFRSHWAGND